MRLLCLLGIHRASHVIEQRQVLARTEFAELYYDESVSVCDCGKRLKLVSAQHTKLPIICYKVTK